MKMSRFSEAMGEVGDKYVEEAICYNAGAIRQNIKENTQQTEIPELLYFVS